MQFVKSFSGNKEQFDRERWGSTRCCCCSHFSSLWLASFCSHQSVIGLGSSSLCLCRPLISLSLNYTEQRGEFTPGGLSALLSPCFIIFPRTRSEWWQFHVFSRGQWTSSVALCWLLSVSVFPLQMRWRWRRLVRLPSWGLENSSSL